MNVKDHAFPTNHGARARLGESGQSAAVRRENLELRRQLQETKLGLRNALQYALLMHYYQESAHRDPRAVPDLSARFATEGTDFQDAGEQGGRTILRLQEELKRAKAELHQLRQLLGTVLNGGGYDVRSLEERLSERYSYGAS